MDLTVRSCYKYKTSDFFAALLSEPFGETSEKLKESEKYSFTKYRRKQASPRIYKTFVS